MMLRLISMISLIGISLSATLTTNKYFNFIKAINKNDFETASLIFVTLSLADYSQRIENCVSIKNKLICKKASLNTERNLGYNRTTEIEQVSLMLQKIEEKEKSANLSKDSCSCCCIQ